MWSRGTLVRLALCWAAVFLVVARPIAVRPAIARADEGDDDDDDDMGGGDDDEGSGGKNGDEEDEDDEDEEDGADTDQPAVTAGGVYTMDSWPIMQNERPLTLNRGMFEVQGGFNMDLSALDAFETWRLPLSVHYGIRDHVELQAGFDFLIATSQKKQTEFEQFGSRLPRLDAAIPSVAVESALYYDLVDFKIGLDFPINPGVPNAPAPDCDIADPTAPCGLVPPRKFMVDIPVGFPFRWSPKKQFAVVGLDKLFTVHLRAKAKPDLTAAVGFVINPVDFLAILIQVELFVPEFNTNFLYIPATAGAEFSPSNRFDVGLRFSFANLKPTPSDEAAGIGAFDRRFLEIYLKARF